MRKKNNWSREEHIIAFNLYCKIEFTKINSGHPEIIKYSQILGRSSSAVAMKLANFARLDPSLQARNVSGLTRGAKGEENVWNEFHGNWEFLAFESERLIARFRNQRLEESAGISTEDLPEGKEREQTIRARINQKFFRSAILSSYSQKCCISGLAIPELLVSSHIIPWSKNTEHRLNPSNGLCLNSIHDSAFDKGFISISKDYKILLSQQLEEATSDEAIKRFFTTYKNTTISLPHKFLPKPEFLEFHRDVIFRK